MENKKIKKSRKPRKLKDKKKISKSKKNVIKQNVKINISTSGGGGGTSTPAPTPLQTFARNEKIGENVGVTNLLNRIGYQQSQQAHAFDNFSNIINSSMQKQQINRDDTIDAAEQINNGIDGDEDKEIVIFPQFAFFDEEIPKFENIPLPIVTPKADTSTQTLFERIPTQTIETQTEPEVQELPEETTTTTTSQILKNEPSTQGTEFGGGGGGPPAPAPAPDKDLYISKYTTPLKNGEVYKVVIKGTLLGSYFTRKDAIDARNDFLEKMKNLSIKKEDVMNYRTKKD